MTYSNYNNDGPRLNFLAGLLLLGLFIAAIVFLCNVIEWLFT
jgi:hypothetical protein